MNLYETLQHHRDSDRYPMHMPGHKRNPEFVMDNPYELDITEVEGMDNLHHPTGVIGQLQETIASHCHAKESFVLVNGSTCGILAAISACCNQGDTIIMARNCHRSVYHGVYLLGLSPVYLIPEQDDSTGISLGILPEQIENALEKHPEAKAVMITSPTYEGVMSDISDIAKKVHERKGCLIVDEAHGAHLAWGDFMPESAMEQGADLVIESLHKTLPALTQTAVLHRCSDRVSREKLCRYLDIYETSSPSYILMASVAQCVDWLEQKGKEAFLAYEKELEKFRQQSKNWQVLSLWENPMAEPSKLVICSGNREGFTGTDLANRLRLGYNIETEMAAAHYVIAMTSVADSLEGLERLMKALIEIDKELSQKGFCSREETVWPGNGQLPLQRMSAYEAMNREGEEILLEESLGRISAEYAFVYPPGIPFLVPGEEIDRNVLRQIGQAKEKRLPLLGLADESGKKIRVVREGMEH